jgi:hypothetical protein
MKKVFFFASTFFLLTIFCSCHDKTNDSNNPIDNSPIKSIAITAVQTDSGVVLKWHAVNFSSTSISNYVLVRGKDTISNFITSQWAGNYEWSLYDSVFLDIAPPFSDKSYYIVRAKLSTGEEIVSNTLEFEFKDALFIKNYKTIASYNDTINNNVFILDSYTQKIRSVNYATKESGTETATPIQIFNWSMIIGNIPNNGSNELYVASSNSGSIYVFDQKTLVFKKTISSFGAIFFYKNNLVYLTSGREIEVMRISDKAIIQIFDPPTSYGNVILLSASNSNKLLSLTMDVPNRIREYTLKTDGTIQSMKDLTAPAAGNDNVYGGNAKIHPSNGTFIGGAKGSIYSASDINLNLNAGIVPEYAFSPDGKYLAVTTNNDLSTVAIYTIPALTQKYSFDIPDCRVQSLTWKGNNVVVVANMRASSYIYGTVIVNKKIPN